MCDSHCFLIFKKFLREKTLIKNFSNTKAVLVTTIPAQKPNPE